MTNKQLLAVIKFKKRKIDQAIPTVKKLLIERYNSTYKRCDMTFNESLSEYGYNKYDVNTSPNNEGTTYEENVDDMFGLVGNSSEML